MERFLLDTIKILEKRKSICVTNKVITYFTSRLRYKQWQELEQLLREHIDELKERL